MENVRRQFRDAGIGKAVDIDELDENLKVEINNFVWMYAPKSMTLDEADDLSLKIYDLFMDRRKQATNG